MHLLPEELKKKLPPLYATEQDNDPIVWVKFFTPWTSWTWYVTEVDGEDTCFGWVEGYDNEFGYFSLSELASVKGPVGLRVERDLYFTPCRLSKVTQKRQGEA